MSHDHIAVGQRVLDIEARAVDALRESLDDDFATACDLMLQARGRVIVTGMGKSGHVGGKLAATLASTGTPAFLSTWRSFHGDLGMITQDDVVLCPVQLGRNGRSTGHPAGHQAQGTQLIGMTGRPQSSLAQLLNVHLTVAVTEEACPHNLAPTSSTTAALAMGDALAIALLEARFTAEDFALSYPEQPGAPTASESG